MTSAVQSASRATLSVVVIVRNEAANIRACLDSVRAVADEIVVHDTGSTDGTQAILDELGVDWFQGAWRDDFSEARNLAMERARCAWILWLDADDRIPADQLEAIRRLKTAPLHQCFDFRVVSPLQAGQTSITWQQLRMVPNHPAVRFRYRCHEQVGLARAAIAAGLQAVSTDVTVLHIGYADPAALVAKGRRNLALLLKEPAAATDPGLAASIGHALAESRQWSLAIMAYDRALAISSARVAPDLGAERAVIRTPQGIDGSLGPGSLLLCKASCLLQSGRLAELEITLRTILALATKADWGFVQIASALCLAELLVKRGEFSEAHAILAELHERHPPTAVSLQLLARCSP